MWISMPFLGLLGGFAEWKKGYAFWSASVDFHTLFGFVGGVCGAEKGHAFWSKSVNFFFGSLEKAAAWKKGSSRFQDGDKENCCLI